MNLTGIPMLSIVTFLPLFGVFWLMFLSDDESGHRNARWIAFYVTLARSCSRSTSAGGCSIPRRRSSSSSKR